MKVTPLKIEGLLLIEPKVYEDDRGFFVERFGQNQFKKEGLPFTFVQDNQSRSLPGVLRGLHYQTDPAQGKLVSVVRGKIWDVAVDIRHESPSFGQYLGLELDSERPRSFWIPAGFAHGFCVLGDQPADVVYKVDGPYNPATEGGIHWWDLDLAIDWPLKKPILSKRDSELPKFKEYCEHPAF